QPRASLGEGVSGRRGGRAPAPTGAGGVGSGLSRSAREERQPGEEPDARGLVVEPVPEVRFEPPREPFQPRDLDADPRADAELGVVVIPGEVAGEPDEGAEVDRGDADRLAPLADDGE